MLQVDDRLRAVLAQPRIDQGDRAAGRGVVLGERADDQVRAGHGPGVEDRLREDHVVGEQGRLLRAVGVTVHSDWIVRAFLSTYSQRPNRIRPSGRTLGIELVDVVDRDGVDVRAVGVHHVQDATPVLAQGTRPLGRVERNTIRPSGR